MDELRNQESHSGYKLNNSLKRFKNKKEKKEIKKKRKTIVFGIFKSPQQNHQHLVQK